MTKPHWQQQHDWWVEDFEFESKQREEFVKLLRKHPDDEMGEIFRDMTKMIDKRIKKLKKEYKEIYGTNFNMRRVE